MDPDYDDDFSEFELLELLSKARYSKVRSSKVKCPKCHHYFISKTDPQLCKYCFSNKFQQVDSGSKEVDKYIKNTHTNLREKQLAWISYDDLEIREQIGQGGFGKIFKALWSRRETVYSKHKGKKENVYKQTVALKIFNDSNVIGFDFLNELQHTNQSFKKYRDRRCPIVLCFGVSREPSSGNLILIMEHCRDGDFHKHLSKDFEKITWMTKAWYLRPTINALYKKVCKFVDPKGSPSNIRNRYKPIFEESENERMKIIRTARDVINEHSESVYTSRLLTPMLTEIKLIT
ncbi:2361_t:CDS:2, partial [Acaulospora morrowiae]